MENHLAAKTGYLTLCVLLANEAMAISAMPPFSDDVFHVCLATERHELKLLETSRPALDSFLARLPNAQKVVGLSVTITRPLTDHGSDPQFSVDRHNSVFVTTSSVDKEGHPHIVKSQPYPEATARQRETIAKTLAPKLVEVPSISVTERFTDDVTDCGIEIEAHTVRGSPDDGLPARLFECKATGCLISKP